MRSLVLSTFVLLSCQFLHGCAPAVVAGAATAGAVTVVDRRPAATVLDDQRIEMKANDALYSDKEIGPQIHVNVTSYNRAVLLTGEVPNQDLRGQAEGIVRGVAGVRDVYNELSVEPASDADTRIRDNWLTASIKGWMLRASNLDLTKVKIVTERSNVYLLGIVTEEEAETAADIARRVEGVKQVSKLFEYLGANGATTPAAKATPAAPAATPDKKTETSGVAAPANTQPAVAQDTPPAVEPAATDTGAAAGDSGTTPSTPANKQSLDTTPPPATETSPAK